MAVLSSPLILIQSVPPVTRTFTLATIISTASYAYLCWKGMDQEATRYMTLVPGSALYAPWTLFTSAFVETSIFEVSINFLLNFNHPDMLWRYSL
jgi:membrane associated rhomboid family serine protease